MGNRRWTDAEVEILEELYGSVPSATIATQLGRTLAGVHEKAGKLGLGPQRPPDVLTAYEVMTILGCADYPRIQRWVRDGQLKAERKPAAYGASKRLEWWIRAGDLERFLRDNPHVIDRDDVDPAWRQFVPERWMTLPEAFRRGAAHPNLLENAVKAGLVPEARQRGAKGTRWAVPERIVPALTEARRRMTSDADHRRLVLRYDQLQRRGRLQRGRSRMVADARATSLGGKSGPRSLEPDPTPVPTYEEVWQREPRGTCRRGHPRVLRYGNGRWMCRECESRRRGRAPVGARGGGS